jgi:hypothetical protein
MKQRLIPVAWKTSQGYVEAAKKLNNAIKDRQSNSCFWNRSG